VESYFRDYFKEKPSPPQEGVPINSVQYVTYEPEIERYGGPTGIQIAEKQFEISSDAVLAVMEEADAWDYDRAMGAAIQLHLGFAFAMGMDVFEACAFYTEIANTWFARSCGYDPNLTAEELKKRREVISKAFKDNFDKQKEILVPYHETLWNAFTGGVEFEQEWLNRWISGMKTIREQLKEARDTGQLIYPPWYKPLTIDHIPDEKRKLWPILESYVHMTNNRLGIQNRDEAFLGYLIKESQGAFLKNRPLDPGKTFDKEKT
jgi:hypothetical protein